ncbi:MAG: ABC transporter ATP-binding protein [Acidobacteria bacterium]|nr:ABC transporter ATP-binding protein [Acidobacteriota bacterium]MBI3655406.1 ABC transporter ATP-binding protein [Acidobacteriota bacterium]
MMAVYALETRELTKVFKSPIRKHSLTALDRIGLTVNQGEIFGLLGPNGAGKTTFVKILLGITHPSEGCVSILGEDLSSVRVKERLGYLPENHKFPGYLTGETALNILGRLGNIHGAESRAAIESWLKRVNMYEWRAMRLKRYSKGMLQRIGLAQSLLNNPELVFLDEPTDGVDPVGRFEIRNILLEQKALGKTIFINSHLLSEVERLCDRVAILNRGKLIRIGSMADLTRATQEYRIELHEPFDASCLSTVTAEWTGARLENNWLNISVGNVADLNRVIDRLRAAAVQVVAVVPVRRSLEETFMDLIQVENPSHG